MNRNLQKKFPEYFKNFEFPPGTEERELSVFRACKTQKIDKESFLNSYEENGFKVLTTHESNDPQLYSMSTYMQLKDLKRYMTLNENYPKPFIIASGKTNPEYGVCAITKEWKKRLGIKYKGGSHVDWWLYEGATPWKDFTEVKPDEYREYFKKS